jgi:adhesin transport system membrane fusion protein
MSFASIFKRTRKPVTELQRRDMPYVSPVNAAQVIEPAPVALWAVYLMLGAIFVALTWAGFAQVDIVAKANGRIVPDGREQVIASLEGGILRELLVREGQQVAEGQALALLDPTRYEAQAAEGTSKKQSLQGTQARLQAEAAGHALAFPEGLPDAVVDGETESYEARQRALNQAVDTNRRSTKLLAHELGVAEGLSAKGLMSEVEVMRVRRQLNDLELQTQERINRYRQDAAAELVRVRNELALMEEQAVVRDDALRRTTLVSPVKGIVKTIRNNTVGGVVAPGAPIMELMPLGNRILVEARVLAGDIGFVKVGHPVKVKLTAYDFALYGAMEGTVLSISPDAASDPDKSTSAEGTWYRAIIKADRSKLKTFDKPVDLLPGMTASVEIRTGQRSVLGFLLRPLVRTQEAFRER